MDRELTPSFVYGRRVAFSDTDAMGVVHHANYLRYCEEARVAWMRARDLSPTHYPKSDCVLALLHYQVWHFKPARFDDEISVLLQVRNEGVRIHFQYVMILDGERIAEAETLHVSVTVELKPTRPAAELLRRLKEEPWTETWLLNS